MEWRFGHIDMENTHTVAEPESVSPISLEGRFVRLRPITREDYGFLWECRCHPDIMHLWMQGRTLPSLEQYSKELDVALSGTILTMLMIQALPSGRTVGFVFAYDHNPYDRYASWTIVMHPAYVNVGWGFEASMLFLDYLFTFFDLRKVCADIYAFNRHSLRLLLRMGAHEEGRFLEHRYYQGAYHDVIRLAATRAEWGRARPKLDAILARRHPRESSFRGDDGRHLLVQRSEATEATEALEALAPVVAPPAAEGVGNSNGHR
jgi:RimJ/RimL family protein N-acetyltransferase